MGPPLRREGGPWCCGGVGTGDGGDGGRGGRGTPRCPAPLDTGFRR